VGTVPWGVLAGVGAVAAVFLALSTVHIGCQEALFASRGGNDLPNDLPNGGGGLQNGGVLSGLKRVCTKPAQWIRWTRWFGTGTLNVVTVAAVVYLTRYAVAK